MEPLSMNNLERGCCCSVWNDTKTGIIVSILINVNCLLIWYNEMPLLTYISYLAIFLIISAFIVVKLNSKDKLYSNTNEYEYISRETIEEIIKMIILYIEPLKHAFNKLASFDNIMIQLVCLIGAYFLSVVIRMMPQILFLLLLINICLFYPLLEQKYSDSLFDNVNKYLKMVNDKADDVLGKIPKYQEKAE